MVWFADPLLKDNWWWQASFRL